MTNYIILCLAALGGVLLGELDRLNLATLLSLLIGLGAVLGRTRLGPILFLYIVYLVMKPKFATPSTGLEVTEIAVRNPDYFGKTLAEIMTVLPAGVWFSAFSTRFEKSCARSWRSPVMVTPSWTSISSLCWESSAAGA